MCVFDNSETTWIFMWSFTFCPFPGTDLPSTLCDWTRAQFTSLLCRVSDHPLGLSPTEKSVPFSYTGMENYAELGDIATLEEGSADISFRNHHFSRINSTPHSPADKVRCLCFGWGGGASCKTRLCSQRWMIACCVRYSSIRCSFWGEPEGGGCPPAEVAVAGNILMKLQM